LEDRLKQAAVDGARHTLIVSDGVFSMYGHVADLPAICDLAERHLSLPCLMTATRQGAWEKKGAAPRR
jgi:glycine C-acetyltransferase